MAKNEVKVSVKVGDDGSLSQVSKKSKRAAKDLDNLGASTDNLNKKRNTFSKQEKGVAGLTSNSTKGFAKQAQTIGGTLVPAYATLAANIFAISAAFNALRNARAVEILEEGLVRVGQASSQNLPLVAQRLKEISGAAVSTAEAMNTVALATSAGFSTTQMEELTRVARGASLALGRNMEDALTRLTRGAAKLEPEILDELGIMVRLDDAATTYGATIGKTADQLTQMERRQAFLNAILDQGGEKFGYIADSVDPNAYDQLAAAFDDLTKSFFNVINSPIGGFISFLAKNTAALIGTVVLFGSTVAKQMLPILFDQASAAAKAAESVAKHEVILQKNIKTTGKLPKIYSEVTDKIIDGTATTEDFVAGQKSLNKSLAAHEGVLTRLTKKYGEHSDQVKAKKVEIAEVAEAQRRLNLAQNAALHTSAATAASDATLAASQLNLRLAFDKVTQAIAFKKAALLADASASASTFGIWRTLQLLFYGVGVSIRTVGAALLAAVPYIGIAIMAFGYIKDIVKSFIPEATEMEKRSLEAAEAFSVFAASALELRDRLDELETAGEKGSFALEARAIGGAFQSVQAEITAVLKSGTDATKTRINEIKAELRGLELDQQNLPSAGNQLYSGMEMQVIKLRGELAALQETASKTDLSERFQEKDLEALLGAVKDGISKLAVFGDSTIEQTKALEELYNTLLQGGSVSIETFTETLQLLGAETIASKNAVDQLDGAVSQFNAELAKTSKKNETAFDPLVDAANGIRNLFIDMSNEATAGLLADSKDKPKWIGDTKDEVNAVVDKLEAANNYIAKSPALVKKLTEEAKRYAAVSKESSEARRLQLAFEQTALAARDTALAQELEIYNTVEAQTENAGRITEIELERAAIANQRMSTEEMNLEVALVELNALNKNLELRTKIFGLQKQQVEESFKQQRIEAELAASNTRRRGNTTALNAKEELDLFYKQREEREKLLVAEKVSKRATVNMEYDLLRAQAALLREQMVQRKLPTTNIDNYISSLDGAQSTALDLINTQFDTANAALTKEGVDKVNDLQNAVLGAAGTGGTVFERLFNVDQLGGFESLDTSQEKFAAVTSAVMPMIESLQALGPEGELAASIANLGVTMGDSFLTAFEQIEEGANKSAAILNAVGSTIGGIAQVAQAASQARISAIDSEIAAEQRRDGKSKESLAKIKAMEVQKDKIARKAFETNKKLMMAQTVVNTAAAVMATMKDTGFFGSPLAMAVAAMGAAQLAIIAGTSYQGGTANTAAPAPSAVSLGSRSTSVDVARSQSVGGEIAYFRGESGSGSAESFRPSFMGGRYRAAGGETVGYTVGEQGPELFVPDRPGTIVPADDSASMMGASTNVNFSINALDATGVEEVLMSQRGNIIGMIRDAANSYGEPFLEIVNTNTYNKSRSGAYRR